MGNTIRVEMTYSVTFTADVDSPTAEGAIEAAKRRLSHKIEAAREGGCEMTDVHVSRLRA